MRQAALVSDESALEACSRRSAIQIDDLYLFTFRTRIRVMVRVTVSVIVSVRVGLAFNKYGFVIV